MLRSLRDVIGFRLLTRGGDDVGKVYDFYIDDRSWRLKYLVAETGSWLKRRRVLVLRSTLARVDAGRREFHVALTRQQLESSPDIDTEKPVSRQQEMLMNAHFGWPADWAAEALVVSPLILDPADASRNTGGDPHLRSFREISHYGLRFFGEIVAKVKDFMLEDSDWSVRQLVASMGGWLDSREVALSTSSITCVSWSGRSLTTEMTREALERLPSYRPASASHQSESASPQ